MKKILSLLLTALLLCALLVTPAAAQGFSDVPAGSWYEDAVNWAVEKNITTGIGGGEFGPHQEVTRGQVVTMLWRIEGEPAAVGSMSFSDVPSGRWYSNAVAWAAGRGIVTGYPDGSFLPNNSITRQELVTILNRYAKTKSASVTAPAGALNGYADASEVSSFALEPMRWAVGNGVVNGTSSVTLSPRGTATRAQLVQMLYRWLKDGHEGGWDLPIIPKP